MEVTCVGQSAFRFEELQELIAEPQLRTFADSKIKFTNSSGMLALLANKKTPTEGLRNCGSVTKHLSFTFLVEDGPAGLEDFLSVSTFTDFRIVSGSLKQFRDAALECCIAGHPLADVFTAFIKYFMSNGLNDIFYDIHKTLSPSGALILKRK